MLKRYYNLLVTKTWKVNNLVTLAAYLWLFLTAQIIISCVFIVVLWIYDHYYLAEKLIYISVLLVLKKKVTKGFFRGTSGVVMARGWFVFNFLFFFSLFWAFFRFSLEISYAGPLNNIGSASALSLFFLCVMVLKILNVYRLKLKLSGCGGHWLCGKKKNVRLCILVIALSSKIDFLGLPSRRNPLSIIDETIVNKFDGDASLEIFVESAKNRLFEFKKWTIELDRKLTEFEAGLFSENRHLLLDPRDFATSQYPDVNYVLTKLINGYNQEMESSALFWHWYKTGEFTGNFYGAGLVLMWFFVLAWLLGAFQDWPLCLWFIKRWLTPSLHTSARFKLFMYDARHLFYLNYTFLDYPSLCLLCAEFKTFFIDLANLAHSMDKNKEGYIVSDALANMNSATSNSTLCEVLRALSYNNYTSFGANLRSVAFIFSEFDDFWTLQTWFGPLHINDVGFIVVEIIGLMFYAVHHDENGDNPGIGEVIDDIIKSLFE